MGVLFSSNPFPVQFADVGDLEKWELLETITPTATGSISTTALAARDHYKIVIKNMVSSAAADSFRVGINTVVTNDYQVLRINNVTVELVTAQANWHISTLKSTHPTYAILYIDGKTPNVANARFMMMAQVTNNTTAGQIKGLAGELFSAADTQLTSIEFTTSTGSMTGIIEIYGVND